MNWIILLSLIIILWGSVIYKPSREFNNLSILSNYYSSYLFDKNLEYFEEKKKDGWMTGATKGILLELGAKKKTKEDIDRKKELNQLKKDLKVAEINKGKAIKKLNKVKKNTKILKERGLI